MSYSEAKSSILGGMLSFGKRSGIWGGDGDRMSPILLGEKRAFVGESVIFSVERWHCGGENVIVWVDSSIPSEKMSYFCDKLGIWG